MVSRSLAVVVDEFDVVHDGRGRSDQGGNSASSSFSILRLTLQHVEPRSSSLRILQFR